MDEQSNSSTPSSPPHNEKLWPARGRISPVRWALRSGLWIVILAGFFFLLRYDVELMGWRYEVIGERPGGPLKGVLVSFRDFAQIVPITVALIIVAVYDRRRKTIIATVILAQILAAVGYSSGKILIARYRPHVAIKEVAELSELTVEQTWLGFQPGNGESATQSFPSGHSAAAFAFAGVMAWFFPALRWLFWVLAVGCAGSRYLDAVHWPSDCLAGATIGYIAAWLILRPYVWGLPFAWFRRITIERSPGELY